MILDLAHAFAGDAVALADGLERLALGLLPEAVARGKHVAYARLKSREQLFDDNFRLERRGGIHCVITQNVLLFLSPCPTGVKRLLWAIRHDVQKPPGHINDVPHSPAVEPFFNYR